MKFPLKIKHFKTFHMPVCVVCTHRCMFAFVCAQRPEAAGFGRPQQSAFYLVKQHLFLNLELSWPASFPSQHSLQHRLILLELRWDCHASLPVTSILEIWTPVLSLAWHGFVFKLCHISIPIHLFLSKKFSSQIWCINLFLVTCTRPVEDQASQNACSPERGDF